MLPNWILVLLPLSIIGGFTHLLNAQTQIIANDSSRTVTVVGDTTYNSPIDSTVTIDTTRMSTPSLLGTYDRTLDSTRFFSRDDLNFLDYRYLGGILETVPGIFIRDQFSAGSYNQLNIRGADWRSIAITSNGRLLNDPASGIFNLYHFSTEYADRIEYITGPRAFLYGVNSAGGAINLVTKNYNSNRPYSKLNYTESAYTFQYSDGTFSQNISRKVNVTLGFQHYGTDGRFVNSADDAWNVRAKVRYNLSKDFNLIFSEYWTGSKTQLNGGIAVNQLQVPVFAFDRILARPVNTEAFEKVSRHDLDLSLVGTLFGDTTNVSLLSFYYTTNLREYRDEEISSVSNGVQIYSDHRSAWMGGLFRQDFITEWQRFSLGANIERRQIEGSPNIGWRRNTISNIWAKEEFVLTNLFTVAGFGRYDNYLGESNLGAGVDASFSPLEWLSLYGGISTSKRFPTYEELFWTDSTVSRTGAISSERHHTAELGVRVNLSGFDVHASFFHRTVENPILIQPGGSGYVFPGIDFINGGKLITDGIEAKLALQIWVFSIEGTGTFITQQDQSGTNPLVYPKFFANGGVYYRKKLIGGNLDLKVGLRARYVAASNGERFNPEVLAYVANPGTPIGFGSSLDGFVIAGLGNAYIHLIWENFTSSRYYITPYYPVLDRAVKFGVSWQFLD
ncbi:MAG: putative porin [bacterium]